MKIISSFKRRTALRATTTRNIDCARSPFCVNEGKTPQDSSSPPRRKCEKIRPQPRRTCIHCRTKCSARRISRNIQYAVLHKQHPYTRTEAERYEGKGEVSSFPSANSTSKSTPPLGARDLRTFFTSGKSAKNPLICIVRQIGRNPLHDGEFEENLEDLHLELECQRSCSQSASTNSVLGENLVDLH